MEKDKNAAAHLVETVCMTLPINFRKKTTLFSPRKNKHPNYLIEVVIEKYLKLIFVDF